MNIQLIVIIKIILIKKPYKARSDSPQFRDEHLMLQPACNLRTCWCKPFLSLNPMNSMSTLQMVRRVFSERKPQISSIAQFFPTE